MEILDSIHSEPITIYTVGERGAAAAAKTEKAVAVDETANTTASTSPSLWWDLCAGPHLERTGQLDSRAIELLSVAGAYWRGDEKNAMLQRIYGPAWQSAEQLRAYTLKQSEARRRDHRVLGRALNLFSIQEDAGGGLVFWHPKGAVVRKLIEDYWKDEHIKVGGNQKNFR